MLDVLPTVQKAMLSIVMVALFLLATIVYPLAIVWFVAQWFQWLSTSLEIKRKLAKRQDFTLCRSRRARGRAIFWRIEKPRIYRAVWILFLAHVPVILLLLIAAILKHL